MNGLAVCGILAGILYFLLFNFTPVYFILFFVTIYFILSWVLIPSSAAKFNSIRRKVQIATWSDPVRPNILGYFQVKIANSLNFLDKISKEKCENITLTHLVFKAIGTVMKDFPDVNGKIAFGNYINHKSVNGTLLVSMDDGVDLYYVPINDIPNKNLTAISSEVKKKAESLRRGKDRELKEKSTNIFKFLPTCITAIIFEVSGFISSNMGIPLPMFNLKRHEFGAFVVTSVGMLNVKVGYPPLVPLFRCPALFCIASVYDEALVVDGQVVVEKVLNICCNVDHRFIDGMRAIVIQNRIREMLENPEKHFSTV
jgi:pyruvate/2-oxoglutarate dehydrogenase complex dihydrolipoamide acyltransferase (E2) component